MNNLERTNLIRREKLDEQNYFQSFLQEAFLNKLLSDREIENIQIQCVELLAKITNQYTKGESSSVRVEVAQNLLMSIFYSISLYLKRCIDFDVCIDDLKQKRISDIYKIGKDIAGKEFKKAKYLYENVRKNLIETDNIAHNDTLQNGLAIFFNSYDMDFAVHETPCSIDYPLCIDIINLTGIEYMYLYLQNVFIENKFCKFFLNSDIENVLRGYDENYKDDLINIFERVLANSLGCVLLNKNVLNLNIELSEIEKLKTILSDSSIDKKLNEATKKLIGELNITDNSLIKYISLSTDVVAEKLKGAVEIDQIDSVFTVPKIQNNKPKIEFNDGVKMEDEDLRNLLEEIRNCDNAKDKIELIKKDVSSFMDLVDILESGYLFDEEFNELFNTFGDTEIALLLKYACNNDFSYKLTGNEEQWQSGFRIYFEGLDIKRREIISLMTKKMK